MKISTLNKNFFRVEETARTGEFDRMISAMKQRGVPVVVIPSTKPGQHCFQIA